MNSSEKKEKSAGRRIMAMVGSFAAGAVLTWTIGAATANTAKSEERILASSSKSAAIQQVSYDSGSASADQAVCDVQLD